MASVTYNGQAFIMDGRRLFIVGASLHYARIPAEHWADRITDAREGGFNTIEVPIPWILHEPRKGRFTFDGAANLRGFVEACGEAGLRVVLRPGPYIGSGYDGGGIPSWLAADGAFRLREHSEALIERVGRYYRKIANEIGDLQASKGGPILAFQLEHAWSCANDEAAAKYLGELSRILREASINVPFYNANNMWTDPVGTIDSWRGNDDLLANLRQLRFVQPDAPRIVSAFNPGAEQAWGDDAAEPFTPDLALRRFGQILAAGAMPIVSPYHGGTNFGFLGGRRPGAGGGITTAAAAGAPVGEAGGRTPMWSMLRRLAMFASDFEHLFADLDPEFQPVTFDPMDYSPGKTVGKSGASMMLVPLRGPGGKVVFVFSDRIGGKGTLLMQRGIRLPFDLGDQPLGWYVSDVDLQGRGRLDYANLCPLGIVDRRMVVFQGPAGMDAVFSVGGTPITAKVPRGAKPLALEHKGLIFVLVDQTQLDNVAVRDGALYVGATRFDAEGTPLVDRSGARVWKVDADGNIATAKATVDAPAKPKSVKITDWMVGEAASYAEGASPRYATLAGPADLPSCGAISGYGWYRLKLKASSTKARNLAAPHLGGRAHLYLDGKLTLLHGEGPGATDGHFTLKLPKGETTLTLLVDGGSRIASGNDLGDRIGLYGHLYEVKALTGVKAAECEHEPIDPFATRGFIYGVAGPSDASQVEWTFTYRKRAPIFIEVNSACRGTFLLNDEPLTYYSGDTGSGRASIMLDPESETFRRGKNVLRFAPDAGFGDSCKAFIKSVKFHEATPLTSDVEWAFAKWEAPATNRFKDTTAEQAKALRGTPVWWRGAFATPASSEPTWFIASGLSKGQLFVNGENVGRYFTATNTGKAVGPQTRLQVPTGLLHEDRPNEVLIFDEHGLAPHKTKIVVGGGGDLD